MNIGFIIPEVGGFNSLSLEFLKWNKVIKDLGHEVYILTGKSRHFLNNTTVMNEFISESESNINLTSKLFDLSDSNHPLIKTFEEHTHRIENIIDTWMETNQIDMIFVENYFSIPFNLQISYALHQQLKKSNCRLMVKHHDAFYRKNIEKLSNNTFIKTILSSCFPYHNRHTTHISSNRIIKSYLKDNCNIESMIIPYVIDFNQFKDKENISCFSEGYSSMLSESFELTLNDKCLLNFSSLIPSVNFENLFKLLDNIQDDAFKIISVVKPHADYADYLIYLKQKIDGLNLNHRFIILQESDFYSSDYVNIDYLFAFSKGVITFDSGVGFGQPLHKAIQHKCPLLFCTKKHSDWLELSDLGCHIVPISEHLSSQDIKTINRFIHLNLDWGDLNHDQMRQYYSLSFLQYQINKLLVKN